MALQNDPYRTRTSVLVDVLSGDGDAFARIYTPLAYGMARRMSLSHPDAEDIAQQVLLEIVRQIRDFHYDRSRGSFRGFIKAIVRRRVCDLKRRRREVLAADAAPAEGVLDDGFDRIFDREWYKTHLSVALEVVRGEVHARTFEAFYRSVLLEQPVEQVAGELGLSPNQVSQYKRRVFERLKQHVEALENPADGAGGNAR
ncbi:MAG: hypothetical protein CHACPFDD_01881 [Phycisphaerae bacterium]|nr:hypothetical protein [Phycisphaerae bacterium]